MRIRTIAAPLAAAVCISANAQMPPNYFGAPNYQNQAAVEQARRLQLEAHYRRLQEEKQAALAERRRQLEMAQRAQQPIYGPGSTSQPSADYRRQLEWQRAQPKDLTQGPVYQAMRPAQNLFVPGAAVGRGAVRCAAAAGGFYTMLPTPYSAIVGCGAGVMVGP